MHLLPVKKKKQVKSAMHALVSAVVIFVPALVFAPFAMDTMTTPPVITAITQGSAKNAEARVSVLNAKVKDINNQILEYANTCIIYWHHRTASYRWDGLASFWRQETS